VGGVEGNKDRKIEEEEEEDSELFNHDEDQSMDTGMCGKSMVAVLARTQKLGHTYAILAWIYSVHPDANNMIKK
jgi:hypothetical protein